MKYLAVILLSTSSIANGEVPKYPKYKAGQCVKIPIEPFLSIVCYGNGIIDHYYLYSTGVSYRVYLNGTVRCPGAQVFRESQIIGVAECK